MESTSETYEISVIDSALTLKKKPTAKQNFDDGVLIEIPDHAKPRHLQFYCKA